MTVSTTHLVILPTYNTGPRLGAVVAEVLQHWRPALVVVDGSTDGSDRALHEIAAREPALTVLTLPRNSGKGAAVLAGAAAARARGFTHALVMDADGQHPAASIQEFMTASAQRPAALVLGRPIFPANIPAERRHGRKISVGLVHFELLGRAVDDPLFGFRVYPLAPLLAVLAGRWGGRRYDFDTEAAVRLGWLGVPPVNRAAPVKYFSPSEGGVTHFHYVRDNLNLAWLHTRLITELLFWRWPALLAHRRRWRAAGFLPVMALLLMLAAAGLGPGIPAAAAAENDPLVSPPHRLAPDTPGWGDLVEAFAHQPDTLADFVEQRHFPFKKDPVVLQGEVRVSVAHGLSLHYLGAEEHTVIVDRDGILMRGADGQKAPPADPRARGANDALLHVLHFDFPALARDFELYGRRDASGWSLALIPRGGDLKHAISQIAVEGTGTVVRHIEIRHSARQYVDITNSPPKATAPFTPEELAKYFR